jgi:hypothetical protein
VTAKQLTTLETAKQATNNRRRNGRPFPTCGSLLDRLSPTAVRKSWTSHQRRSVPQVERTYLRLNPPPRSRCRRGLGPEFSLVGCGEWSAHERELSARGSYAVQDFSRRQCFLSAPLCHCFGVWTGRCRAGIPCPNRSAATRNGNVTSLWSNPTSVYSYNGLALQGCDPVEYTVHRCR